ncbi:MAG TPA: PA14 domain-containing protein [Planctomycetota bacterium]|nr:PA14 domain-containing protein [Planctomycetota bacterium]
MKIILLALLGTAGPAPAQDDDLRPGLVAEYFDVGEEINDFPTLKGLKPVLRRVEKDVNIAQTNGPFNGSGLVDTFTVRWTGTIAIPKAGRYQFITESDDGSRVFIDGKLVVDNGGCHIPEEKDGAVELAAGKHPFRLDYFENNGGASCRLKWASDEFKAEIIPAKVFFHKKDADLDK